MGSEVTKLVVARKQGLLWGSAAEAGGGADRPVAQRDHSAAVAAVQLILPVQQLHKRFIYRFCRRLVRCTGPLGWSWAAAGGVVLLGNRGRQRMESTVWRPAGGKAGRADKGLCMGCRRAASSRSSRDRAMTGAAQLAKGCALAK